MNVSKASVKYLTEFKIISKADKRIIKPVTGKTSNNDNKYDCQDEIITLKSEKSSDKYCQKPASFKLAIVDAK